jgi:pimeloyl-ACP methyl ester carboxylesterase
MKRILTGLAALIVVGLIALFVWGYAPDRDPAVLRTKYANAASQFVDLGGGLTVHVRDEGKRDGPVLVLLHGSNASVQTWEPWVARLGGKYRIISYDQIGHGITGPNPTDDYSVNAFVDVLDRLVLKMGVSRFALAGNSMGGGIALSYAMAHPDKLTALVLVDAGGAPDAKPSSLPIGFRIARMPVINRLAEVITPRSLIEKSVRQTVSNQAIVDDKMVDRYWDLLLYPGNRRATGLRFSTLRKQTNEKAVAAIKIPTLILWGEEDKLIPVSAGRWFAKTIPGSTLITYPGIGHIPMEETPDKSAADVDTFLGTKPPASR